MTEEHQDKIINLLLEKFIKPLIDRDFDYNEIWIEYINNCNIINWEDNFDPLRNYFYKEICAELFDEDRTDIADFDLEINDSYKLELLHFILNWYQKETMEDGVYYFNRCFNDTNKILCCVGDILWVDKIQYEVYDYLDKKVIK